MAEGGEVAAESTELVEDWVARTQAALGQLISKPRMLPDRLRRPPFRFLFDVALELARATGFGLNELFGGVIGEKPAIPSSKDEKVSFLQRWLELAIATLGSSAGELPRISVQSVVCGIDPEWTNYMLQCIAVAAQIYKPPPPVEEQFEVVAPEAVAVQHNSATTLETAAEQQVREEMSQHRVADSAATEARAAEFRREVEERSKYLQDLDKANDEFSRTAQNWQSMFVPGATAGDAAAEDSDDGDEDLSPLAPDSRQCVEESKVEVKDQALSAARVKAENVNSAILEAQNLLDSIEAGLDGFEERASDYKKQKEQELRDRVCALQHQAEIEAAAVAAASHAAEEAKATEKAERARRRAEKKALKAVEEDAARREAELAEQQRKKYPTSKHAAAAGARMVSCVGGGMSDDEEYKWDADEDEPAAPAARAAPVAPIPQASYRDDDLGACLTDEMLASGPAARDPLDFLSAQPGQAAAKLFDQLKAQLKDTFVSYLCASMPETLLRQHTANEIVDCLQVLLRELRACLTKNGLEDIAGDEPPSTSVTDVLCASHPKDWLMQLQSGSAWALCSKFPAAEVIDTVQSLCQSCFERLDDAIGPIELWAEEGSPLRYVPPVQQEKPPQASLTPPPPPPPQVSTAVSGARQGGSTGQWSSTLAPAPWEVEEASNPPPQRCPTAAPARLGTATAASRLCTASQERPRSKSPAPVFDASLGPAPWEMEHAPRPPTHGGFSSALGPAPWEVGTQHTHGPPGTAAFGVGVGSRAVTAASTLHHAAQRPTTQQAFGSVR